MNLPMFYIYKITNHVTAQVYIGQTKRAPEVRWKQHIHDSKKQRTSFKLHQALNKYGAEHFTIEVLECVPLKELADLSERMWIEYYDAIDRGYNTAKGGSDGGARKRVMAVEDGIVFESMVDACAHYGLSHGALHLPFRRGTKAGGQHWIFVK